jgi:HAD superfamily hydrolase (TIGR01509 family)
MAKNRPKVLQNIDALLFDLDGTLVDSSEAIIGTIEKVLASKGWVCERDRIIGMIGMPLEEIFRVFTPDLSHKEIWNLVREYREYYLVHHLEKTRIDPSTIISLKKLKEGGFKLGITTGKYREPVYDVLEHFGILELFDTVVTGYEVKMHKPAPDIVIEAARRLQVDPKRCAVIGDSPIDIQAGKRAGSFTIGLLSKTCTRRQMEKEEPDCMITHLDKLSAMFSSRNRRT